MEFEDSNVGLGGGRAAKVGTLDRFLHFFSPRRTSEVSPPTQRSIPPPDSTSGWLVYAQRLNQFVENFEEMFFTEINHLR